LPLIPGCYECMTMMSYVRRRTVSENRKHMKLNLDFETLVRKVLTCARNHNNYNKHGRKFRGGLGPHLTQSRLGWDLAPYQVASWSMQPFGRNRYGPKIGCGLCPFGGGGAGSPSETMWSGPRPTCMPSFILIRPTVWPQCTNVTDRTEQTGQTDKQRSDSIGRTVL